MRWLTKIQSLLAWPFLLLYVAVGTAVADVAVDDVAVDDVAAESGTREGAREASAVGREDH